MKTQVTKTIDIDCLEWWDKVNGNSYFAGTVYINYGMPDESKIYLPFQYGYGNQYSHEAGTQLAKEGYLPGIGNDPLWRYCKERNIILRQQLTDRCKKRELTIITKMYEQENKKKLIRTGE